MEAISLLLLKFSLQPLLFFTLFARFLFSSRDFFSGHSMLVRPGIARYFERCVLLTIGLRLIYVDLYVDRLIGIVDDGGRAASCCRDRSSNRGSNDVSLGAGKFGTQRGRGRVGGRGKPDTAKWTCVFAGKNVTFATRTQNHGVHRRAMRAEIPTLVNVS
jgi:hypothetical protein